MCELVSVIIPVYESEAYLKECVQSVQMQSYKNVEILLIDDGSTDGSSSICNKYKAKDKRIVYYRQENLGICSARNKGISMSKGKYIAFSDHDDEYEPDYIKKQYEVAEEYGADVVKCGVLFEDIDDNRVLRCTSEKFYKEYRRENIVEVYFKHSLLFGGVWNGLYLKKMLISSGVLFDESMKFGQEDFMFNIQLIPYIDNFIAVKEILYKHYKRYGQSTSSKFRIERLDAMIKFYKEEINVLCKDDININTKLYYNLTSKIIASITSYFRDNCVNDDKNQVINDYKEYLGKLPLDKIYTYKILISPEIGLKRIIILLLAKYKKYELILKLYNVL